MNLWHHLAVIVSLFVVGASIGSFLNVVIHRLPLRMSLLRPGSRCPRCGHGISVRDNVPILGWVLLKGCCRNCELPISARYPLVEILTGGLVALGYCVDLALSATDPIERGVLALGVGLLVHVVIVSTGIVGVLVAYDACQGIPSSRPQ